jgi:2-oxoglutarate ferredoxin oxidoreductase subunit alpha
VPREEELPRIPVRFHTEAANFAPYMRDPVTLARPWAVPGTPGLEHRIGGLEKEDVTGEVSYDAWNHEKMISLREQKVMGIAESYPPTRVDGPEEGRLLLLGWGSTYGAIRGAFNRCQAAELPVAQVHLRHVWPLPRDLGQILARYETVLVPEMNRGQLARILRSEYLRDVVTLSKVQGRPFKGQEIFERVQELLGQHGGQQ